MANEFVIRKGYKSLASSEVTGSLTLIGNYETIRALTINSTKGSGTEHYFRTHGVNGDTLAIYSGGNRVLSIDSNSIDVLGSISGSTYYGDGSNLTNVTATSFTETDTLATVTGRGATTSTAVTLGEVKTTSQVAIQDTTFQPLSSLFEGTLVVQGSTNEDPIIAVTDVNTANAAAGVFHQSSTSPGFPALVINAASNGSEQPLISARTNVNNTTGTGGTEVFAVDGDGDATFAGDVTANNLSGTNTGDQTLPTDFVSKASGGTFGNALAINHSAFTGLTLTRSTANGSNIDFNNSGGLLGRTGFLSNGTFAITNSTIGTSNMMSLTSAGDATFTGDVTVAGTLTAQEFHTEFVSASIIYESGSTKFGDTSDDNHDFTGSINLTGSMEIQQTVDGSGLVIRSSNVKPEIRFIDDAASQVFGIGYNRAGNQLVIDWANTSRVEIAEGGTMTLNTINQATSDTDKFLVSDSGAIKYRSGSQVLSDIGAAASSHTHAATDITSGLLSNDRLNSNVFINDGGTYASGYTGDMDSVTGFRVLRSTSGQNRAFSNHHNVLNLPNTSATSYEAQLAMETGGTGLAWRGSSNGTFTSWYTIWHAGNDGPTSGLAAQTAATATNADTASYVDYSNLAGTVPTWNQDTTGNAATATTADTASYVAASDIDGSVNADTLDSINSTQFLRSDAADTASELITFQKGISQDGNAKFYTWRALDNTSSTSNQYFRIARITSNQSSRFSIEIAGRSTSYSDPVIPAMGYIVGQLNNDNNYDIVFYNHSTATSQVVSEVGQVDVSITATDIYIKAGQYAELSATGHISDGSITTYGGDSASATAPTNYIAATEVIVWNSGNDGLASGLVAQTAATASYVDYSNLAGTVPTWNQDTTGNAATATTASNAMLLDGIDSTAFLRSNVDDTMTGVLTFSKENASPSITFHNGGNDMGTNAALAEIDFTADYQGSPIPYGSIQVKTNASAVRADIDFIVKSTSGNQETALKLQGGAGKPKSFFYNDMSVEGEVSASSFIGDGSGLTGISAGNNYYLTGLSFATSTGVLTATVDGASNPTVDLDGRYRLDAGSELPSTTDLDTLTTTGIYAQNSNNQTSTANNYPDGAGFAGIIENINDPGNNFHTSQMYFKYNGNNDIYHRYRYDTAGGNAGWSGWAKLWTTRNDGPTSGLAAQTAATASYYVETDTLASVTGRGSETTTSVRFKNDLNYFGLATTNNEGEIIINTGNAGSPQIGFTEHGDASWAIGIDDGDNSFKIHGTANATIPTLNNLASPLFEIDTGGAISSSNGALLNGDVTLGTYAGTKQARLILTGTTANKQSIIKTTNGNLHIDAEAGHALYLNYYEGTTDNVIIGNASSGASGTILKSTGRVNVGEHLIAVGSVYSDGGYFVFGTSTSEGEYIERSGNDIRFVAGGSTRMTVDGDGGNVGIGTTSPSQKLHVVGTVKSSGLDVDGQANSATNFLQYTRTDSSQPASISYDGTGGFDFNLNGGTIKFSDSNGGSVGIGTTSPGAKLTVEGSGSTVFDVQGSQGQLFSITDDLTGDLFSVSDISGIPLFNVHATDGIVIDTDTVMEGNLTLSGSLNVTGSAFFNGNITNTPAETPGVHIGISAGNDGQVQIMGSSAHIDFANAASEDYDMRIILQSNDELGISGGNLDLNGNSIVGVNTITATTFSGNASTATSASHAVQADNAHTLDGLDSSQFIRSDVDDSVTNKQLRFYSNDAIESTSGAQASLEVYQDTAGSDAFMAFHVAGDYAAYFGLDGASNDLVVGGWSKGAVKQRIFHDGYHPNADAWTTGRTITIGSTGKTVNGSGNVSWTLAEIGALGATAKAADSELIDGIDSSRIVYGDGANKITDVSDFNSRNNPSGFYQGYQASNSPTTGTWYNMINVRHSNTGNSHGFQIAASYYDENIWSRTYSGGNSTTDGNYTTWRRLYHEGHKPTLAEIGAAASSHVHSAADITTGTYADLFSSSTRYNIGFIDGSSSQSRDKIRVWNSSLYTMGMKNGYDFGYLGSGEYAMSFQMNDNSGRGFWWGDDVHTDDQGAMSLTTDGRLMVATRISVGNGQSATGPNNTATLSIENGGSTGTIRWNNSYGAFNLGLYYGLPYIANESSGNTITGLQVGNPVSGQNNFYVIRGSAGIGVSPSTTIGRLDCSNDIVAYSSSDRRWKENIKTIENPIDKVKAIGGYEFDWKELTDDETTTQHSNKGHDIGVIAQEIEEVLPEVVTTRENGYKGVRYEKITPLLIEAIKEQQKQIDELKAIVNKLQNDK